MDRLQAMATFVRVVETGSFSAVARETNTTQGAVSKQVAALEKTLGARLLTRTTRSLALTEEGERYFEQARRLVAEIAEAESELQRGEQQLHGWLRVAGSVGFGRLKLMPVVRSFLARHPQVRIDLRLNDSFIDLVKEGIDASICIGELPDSSLLARRVGRARRLLLAHRDYLRTLPAGQRPPRVPEDLAQHNCIVYTAPAHSHLWSFTAGPGAPDAPGTQRAVQVEGTLQTNSSEVIRASLLAGMGIAHAPEWLMDREIASGEMVHLLPEWLSKPMPIHVVTPPQRRHSAKVRAFADHVEQALARESPQTLI